MSNARACPIRSSYWVADGLLLAGEYPGICIPDEARERIGKFLDAGIRTFINLTETSEPLTLYDDMLRELADERGVEATHLRFSIPDGGVPLDREQMARILAAIRGEIVAGRPVYVHCWGGMGRTGTVVGCWLVEEEGLDGTAAIARIAELRATLPEARRPSPERDTQCRFVCEWGDEST